MIEVLTSLRSRCGPDLLMANYSRPSANLLRGIAQSATPEELPALRAGVGPAR